MTRRRDSHPSERSKAMTKENGVTLVCFVGFAVCCVVISIASKNLVPQEAVLSDMILHTAVFAAGWFVARMLP